VEEDFPNGVAYMKKAIQISEKIGDILSLWIASVQLGCFLLLICEFDETLTYLKTNLQLSELANNPMGISASNAYFSYTYALQGHIDLACKVGDEPLRVVNKHGDVYFKGEVYPHYGTALYYRGMFDEAEKTLLEGLAFCEKTSHVAWGFYTANNLGCLYFDKGAYVKAQEYYNKALTIAGGAKFLPSLIKVNKICLANARIHNQDKDINLGDVFEYSKNIKLKVCEGIMARNIGDILLHVDDDNLTDAEVWFQKAIEADSRNGMRWQLAYDHALYADWFKKKGDIQGAKEQLTKAIDLFRECGADGWVTRTEKTLAELQ
jgi:tetratricopeptide (TPR) repeat protein